jgi:hypothetical protein
MGFGYWCSLQLVFLFLFLTVLGSNYWSKYEVYRKHCQHNLLALWLISVALAISIGKTSFLLPQTEGWFKENIMLPTDTLHTKFKHNDYYAKNIDDRDGFKIAQIQQWGTVPNDVRLRIENRWKIHLISKLKKRQKGIISARQRAEQIKIQL